MSCVAKWVSADRPALADESLNVVRVEVEFLRRHA
jgi:hypothetical protein